MIAAGRTGYPGIYTIMPKKTIHKKLLSLVTSNLVLTVSILLALLLGVAVFLVRSQLNSIERSSRASLKEKGSVLIVNNSQVLRGLVEDHAFGAIRELLGAAVREDPDIEYGVFMDTERRPWAMTGKTMGGDTGDGAAPLADELSLWAYSLAEASSREIRLKTGATLLEVAAPVVVEGRRLGTIRYGLSTRRMIEAINAQKKTLYTVNIILGLGIIAVMGVALFIGSLRARQQAFAITNPLGELMVAAGKITAGNYSEPVHAKSDDEVGELAQTFETMRTTMKQYTENLESMVRERTEQLHVLLGEKEERLHEINSDLELARLVQQSLLPSDVSKTPGLKVAAFYRPQSAIGGDLYDVAAIDEHKTSILMFDVSGHGIAAALYGARALAEFTRSIRMGMNPESVLGQVHKELVKFSQDNRYLTAFLGFYDRSLGQFTFSRAGHPPAMVVRQDTGAIERLSTKGSYLGMTIGSKIMPAFEEKTISLREGDRIVVFTDGVIECLGNTGEKFGSHRLENALVETRNKTAEGVVAEVVSRLDAFSGTAVYNDDVTLVCAEAVGPLENLPHFSCTTGD